jgi:hypothetical protein
MAFYFEIMSSSCFFPCLKVKGKLTGFHFLALGGRPPPYCEQKHGWSDSFKLRFLLSDSAALL